MHALCPGVGVVAIIVVGRVVGSLIVPGVVRGHGLAGRNRGVGVRLSEQRLVTSERSALASAEGSRRQDRVLGDRRQGDVDLLTFSSSDTQGKSAPGNPAASAGDSQSSMFLGAPTFSLARA